MATHVPRSRLLKWSPRTLKLSSQSIQYDSSSVNMEAHTWSSSHLVLVHFDAFPCFSQFPIFQLWRSPMSQDTLWILVSYFFKAIRRVLINMTSKKKNIMAGRLPAALWPRSSINASTRWLWLWVTFVESLCAVAWPSLALFHERYMSCQIVKAEIDGWIGNDGTVLWHEVCAFQSILIVCMKCSFWLLG